jgi:Fe-S cluster biogenesis protein NfuA/nitrite reductase/ring-hydroxylating ferredoxin subunit
MDDREAREAVARVEALLDEVEALPDARAREASLAVVQALLELYGEGLSRVMERAHEPRALAEDELVSHLLLIHGLHPVSLEERVDGALDEVRPYLASHGGGVELVGLGDGVVRLRLRGSCEGCPSSAMTLKLAVEEAIHKAAPDVESIEAEGATAPAPAGIPLPMVGSGAPPPAPVEGRWAVAGALPQLAGGGTHVARVGGEAVLFLRLDGAFYAYGPSCPACGGSLEGAALEAGELACPGCARRYDARRAGRCLDAPSLHLRPIPLLEADTGVVKVALAAAAA